MVECTFRLEAANDAQNIRIEELEEETRPAEIYQK